MAFAHSRNAAGVRHDLVAHLRAVGLLSAEFARAFGSNEVGYWIGLWHDVGKFDPRWQDYLLAARCRGRAAAFGRSMGLTRRQRGDRTNELYSAAKSDISEKDHEYGAGLGS